jgi:ferric-dicitrate binding protein FerR (iron transport regulator)
MREVATRRGQRAVLDLPDGSRAVIAPESRLRFAASFGARRRGGLPAPRDLFLEGEGYFEVQPHGTRPFRVHVANAVVEDIGTEFIVASRPEKPGLEVVVVAGAVTLRRDSSDARPWLRLSRGDLARVDPLGTAVLTRNVNLDRYVAWTKGMLVYDGTPLREAAVSLSRWLDLDISVPDRDLAERRLTATFEAEKVSQVLELIARSLDAHVERSGRAVVFTQAGGQ